VFYDTKIIIKANIKDYNFNETGIKYMSKMKGLDPYLLDLLAVNFLELAIDNGLTKKDVLDHFKNNYELVLKEKESRK
jgi:hypothetical protein